MRNFMLRKVTQVTQEVRNEMERNGVYKVLSTGKLIKQHRKAAGLTQKELAERIGISCQGIAQWENGLRNPKIDTLKKIATALDIPASYLIPVDLTTRNGTAIDPQDDNFGAVLNCAVRYALGRQSYMPGLIIDYITPLLPEISDRTLYVLDQDITERKYCGGYGDPYIDKPDWMRFLEKIHEEQKRRGVEPYRDWRKDNDNR